MLKVYCGPFQPALEDAFIQRLAELRRENPLGPIAVVTPSRALAERLERLVAIERGRALLGVEFHTFFSLAMSVVENAGFPDKNLLSDPLFFDRLMDMVLDEHPDLVGSLGAGPKRASRSKSLARGLRSSLRDLIDAGVSPAQIEEHFGEELKAAGGAQKQLLDFIHLARLYEQKTESLKILSSSGLTRLAARAAEQNSPYLSRFSEIIYYGFYDLTGLQSDFFEAVAQNYPASLLFPYRKAHPAFSFANTLFEQKILGLASEVVHLEPRSQETALGQALDQLFSPEPSPKPLSERLRFISASGRRDEIWVCAKEITALVESGFCQYEDIGVLARGLEPYRSALVEVFEENAIPYSLNLDEPLLRRPLAKTALNLLMLKRRDFPARLIEDIISSPYFHGDSSFSPRRAHLWKILIGRLQIHAGWLQWQGKLEEIAKKDFEISSEDGPSFVIAQEEVASLWKLLLDLDQALRAPLKSWHAAAELVVSLVDGFLKLPADASEDEALVLEEIKRVLKSLSRFDDLGAPPTWDDVLDTLEEKFKSARLGILPAGRGVRALDVMAARGESFKVLFLIGLKEKTFPREIREDPILRDAQRAFLRHPIGCWIGLKAAGYEEERLLFYLAVASAKEKLYCVYPRSDESGKAEVPSYYLLQLCRAVGVSWDDDAFWQRVARRPGQKILECAPQHLCAHEVSVRLALQGQNPAEYRTLLDPGAGLLADNFARLKSFTAWAPGGALDGLIEPPQEYLRRLQSRGLSQSALKTFMECPFRFFAERVLDLGPGNEALAKSEMAATERGIIYHQILDHFYQSLGPSAAAPENWQSGLSNAIESVFTEHHWKVMGLYPLLWQAQKQAMTEHLRAFVDWDLRNAQAQGFYPMLFEKELRAPWPGKALTHLPELFLRGRLDRLDGARSGGQFRLVDYKTKISNRTKKDKEIQFAFYADLAAAELDKAARQDPAWRLESARVFGIEAEDDMAREDIYTGEAWRENREAFWAQAAKDLERISQGHFPIRPDDKGDGNWGHCAWCAFSTICRKNHGPSRVRAREIIGAEQ